MNTAQVIFIHDYLTRYFNSSDDPISPSGIKNLTLLDSAVNRPFMSVGGSDAYNTVFDKGAALFHSLINNHCFHNGNKRTALLSTLVYLSENGYLLNSATDDELFEFTRKSAAHELSEDRQNELSIISSWLENNSRRRKSGEHQLKFSDLREILIGFEYDITECTGRTHDIIKNGVVVTSILQKGGKGKEDYDKQYISKLRKKLKLTSDYGVDSYMFYGDRGFDKTLGRFMKMRDKVMRELAKI
ncbi:type II toxin-antitoxin system death-on-curing family toxin [Aeromonas crassostreae]